MADQTAGMPALSVESLASELTAVRRRGLAKIDMDQPARIDTPNLDAIARRAALAEHRRPPTSRPALIGEFLASALIGFADHGDTTEAGFIKALFFAPTGSSASASELRQNAMQTYKMTGKLLDARRATSFRLFAEFLMRTYRPDETPEPTGATSAGDEAPAATKRDVNVSEPLNLVGGVGDAGEPSQPAPSAGEVSPDATGPVAERPRHRRTLIFACAAVLAIAVIAVVGLIRSGSNSPSAATVNPPTAAATGSNSVAAADGPVQMTFDSLGGSTSQVIKVYPGPSDSSVDRAYSNAYPNGETAEVGCKTRGRTVTSDTAAGERARSSDIWLRLATPEAQPPQFASLIYASVDQTALDTLPNCT